MHRYLIVDAFSDSPLMGNPVAVFFDCADLPADLMQRIAREMNLSEVTFLLPAQEGTDARVRIFTPVNELPFAGHPLLGTAAAMRWTASAGMVPGNLAFETHMGVIDLTVEIPPAAAERRKDIGLVRMRQPVPEWQRFGEAGKLAEALGVTSSTLPVDIYKNGPRHVLVGLPSVAELSRVNPDQRLLAEFHDMAVECFAGAGNQWRMRMFSPAYGVAEDAATGSAAGPLAIHLARYGLAGYGSWIEIWQGVEMGRKSVMFAKADGAANTVRRVEVKGHATVIAEGALFL
jgi:trans-2,3-dihydro-3-hydroxyanthranilate isomerase